jgi:hypothetical protein
MMKLARITLSLFLLALLAGVAYVGQQGEPAGTKMAGAAEQLLAALNPKQQAKATFDFNDKERINWHFVPLENRKGLPLKEMNAAQKKAALALVAAGTSPQGNQKATTIMSLESILREQEMGKGPVRDPENYYFTVFGKPSKTAKWGWRVEGHHLSLNFVVDGGKVAAATPAFFGANPAAIQDGPRKGLRILAEAEDLAIQLYKDLTDEQKKTAYQDEQFPEIEQAKKAPNVGEPKGLAAADMNKSQRELLVKLLTSYARRMPADIGEEEMSQVKEAGIDKIHFGYAGGVEAGKPHTYRIQGPTFIVEFLNVQNDSGGNPANHIHSAWRNIKGDFGLGAE